MHEPIGAPHADLDENRRLLYLTSKYGGMLLSVLTLLLYNRYVSDVLSSVKAFEAHLLRSLDLHL